MLTLPVLPFAMPFFHSVGNGGYDREGDRDGSPCREKCTAAVRSGSLLDHVCLYASCFGFFLEGRLETVLQSSFSARGYAVEAIYATGGIYGEVLAVDCLRLTSMLAITTMRTSFFVKGDPENEYREIRLNSVPTGQSVLQNNLPRNTTMRMNTSSATKADITPNTVTLLIVT